MARCFWTKSAAAKTTWSDCSNKFSGSSGLKSTPPSSRSNSLQCGLQPLPSPSGKSASCPTRSKLWCARHTSINRRIPGKICLTRLYCTNGRFWTLFTSNGSMKNGFRMRLRGRKTTNHTITRQEPRRPSLRCRAWSLRRRTTGESAQALELRKRRTLTTYFSKARQDRPPDKFNVCWDTRPT